MYEEIERYLSASHRVEETLAGKKYKTAYIDVPCAFDIETSTQFDLLDIGYSNMYIWQFGIGWFPDDYIIVTGRTWDEFMELYDKLVQFKKSEKGSDRYRLHCWVHNLSFEFQFLKDRIKWYHQKDGTASIFAVDNRKPIKAETEEHIVFHDSYIQSNKSLADVGKELKKYKTKKRVGDLDYSKMRNAFTPLTPEEYDYCIGDIEVLLAYEREEIEEYGNVESIPMTNTKRVRDAVAESVCDDSRWNSFGRKDSALDLKKYRILAQAFQGGFTHANPFKATQTYENVTSIDFTSSYPTVLFAEKYPTGKSEFEDIETTNEELMKRVKHWCGRVHYHNLVLKADRPDGIISASKCVVQSPDLFSVNGRVLSATDIDIYETEVDYKSIEMFYDYDSAIVSERITWKWTEYLSFKFREVILKMYQDKTKFKGVEGEEGRYMRSKNMFNSLYGMSVTAWIQDTNIYDTDDKMWCRRLNSEVDKESYLTKKSNDRLRYTRYETGIYCTAYARYNLFCGIKSIGMDYLYSDTDSIKFTNLNDHMDFIQAYNKDIIIKLNKSYQNLCYWEDRHNQYLNFPSEFKRGDSTKWLAPLDKHGLPHQLGVWDIECTYEKFKALRAKAYLVQEDGKLQLTLAGCNKKGGTEYFEQFENPFDEFTLDTCIPIEYTRKLVPQYHDVPMTWTVKDYNGVEEEVTELSWVSLKPVAFSMNEDFASSYARLLDELRKELQR